MGRKKGKVRTERFELRLTPSEKQQLKTIASAAGLSVAGYLLGCALGESIATSLLPKNEKGDTPDPK